MKKLFLNTNQWNFTRLGKIRDVTQSELKQILGNGNVTVKLSTDGTSAINDVKAEKATSTQMYSIDGKTLKSKPHSGIYIETGIKRAK